MNWRRVNIEHEELGNEHTCTGHAATNDINKTPQLNKREREKHAMIVKIRQVSKTAVHDSASIHTNCNRRI